MEKLLHGVGCARRGPDLGQAGPDLAAAVVIPGDLGQAGPDLVAAATLPEGLVAVGDAGALTGIDVDRMVVGGCSFGGGVLDFGWPDLVARVSSLASVSCGCRGS